MSSRNCISLNIKPREFSLYSFKHEWIRPRLFVVSKTIIWRYYLKHNSNINVHLMHQRKMNWCKISASNWETLVKALYFKRFFCAHPAHTRNTRSLNYIGKTKKLVCMKINFRLANIQVNFTIYWKRRIYFIYPRIYFK